MKIIGSTTSNTMLLVEVSKEELANIVGEEKSSIAEYRGIYFNVGSEIKVSEIYKKLKQFETDFSKQVQIAKELEGIATHLKTQLNYLNPPAIVPTQAEIVDSQKRYDIDL